MAGPKASFIQRFHFTRQVYSIVLTHLKGAHESLIDAHHGAGVVKLPAVVGGREQGDQLTLGKEFIAVLHDLKGYEQCSVTYHHIVRGSTYMYIITVNTLIQANAN